MLRSVLAPGPHVSDITQVLTSDELAALRAGYDPARMVADVRTSLEVLWPPATGLVESVLAGFYVPLPETGAYRIEGGARERVVLAVLACGHGQPFDVAVHCYWGLMEGLDVGTVADTLLLTALYGGVARYTDGTKILGATLGLLKQLVAAGRTDCHTVVGAIGKAFPVSVPLLVG